MSEILGMRFRRNKYGVSLWEDTVAEIIYEREIITDIPYKVDEEYLSKTNSIFKKLDFLKKHKIGTRLIPKVLGKNTLKSYTFDEIIFTND